VTQATGELQKAGSAIQAEDYMGAQALLAGTKERLQKAVPAVTGPAGVQSTRPRT
jgi:hypothetical protein